MSLKGYFCLIVLAAWNLGSWEFLINYPFDVIIWDTFFLNGLCIYIFPIFSLSNCILIRPSYQKYLAVY